MLHAPACGVVVVEKPFVQGGTHTHTSLFSMLWYVLNESVRTEATSNPAGIFVP